MGEVFAGRYELVDPIGRGGVGAVWRAWDHRRRRYVAAKVLQQSDAHALLRFVREQALRIDHPHVLAPASWAADDDKVLFTMDLVAGGSLVHLVGDYGPLPPAFVCTLLDQLLSGLAAVHAEKVVHRDIKPANILLEATGTARPRLRLSDFGIAMRLGEPRLTETDYVVGTPGYLAPEQLLGAEPDFTADLFAVGLVALYLLQGAKPDVRALVEYFAAHGTPTTPRGVPGPLWEVLATLLQPDPAARFRTATGARKALATAVELLPEPGRDDEQVEIFDQLGPLPAGFGPQGPLRTGAGTAADGAAASGAAGAGGTAGRRGMGSSGLPTRPHGPGTGVSGPSAPPDAPETGNSGLPPTPPEGPGAGGNRLPPLPQGSGTGASGSSARPEGPGARSGPAPITAGSIPPRPTTAPATTPGTGMPTTTPGTGTPVTTPGIGNPTTTPGTGTPAGPGGDGPRVAPGPPPPAVRPTSAPPVVPPMPTVDPTPRPATMSDTGSFHLPPPLPRGSLPAVPGPPEQPPSPPAAVGARIPAAPARTPHHEPTRVPSAPPSAAPAVSGPQPAYAYAVASPHTPTQPQRTGRHGRRAVARRPGPPAKVAVPVLLVALVCYAVGFWALTRI